MRASEVCTKAAELVGGNREETHGDKVDNFSRIAALWNGWMEARRGAALRPLDAHDVGVMMVLLKLARTQSGTLNPDDYIDAAGYAGCAAQVAAALSQDTSG